jgi:uncharacterized protein
MTNEEKLEKVRELTELTYKKLKCWGHGWQHILNVVEWSKKIAEREGADPFLCQVAAYCHDLGRLEEEERKIVNYTVGTPSAHGALSVKPTEKILDEIGVSGNEHKDIIEAVKLHNIRKYEGPNLILTILQDADRADGFSKFAILRFAAFNCQMPIPEPQNEEEINSLYEKVKFDLRNDPDRKAKMLHTLDYVFGWYDTLLNTGSAREYLADGYKFLKKFYEEIKSVSS